jgi:hypothetical protein
VQRHMMPETRFSFEICEVASKDARLHQPPVFSTYPHRRPPNSHRLARFWLAGTGMKRIRIMYCIPAVARQGVRGIFGMFRKMEYPPRQANIGPNSGNLKACGGGRRKISGADYTSASNTNTLGCARLNVGPHRPALIKPVHCSFVKT